MFWDILISVTISLFFFVLGIVFQYVNVFGIIRKKLIQSRKQKRQAFLKELNTNEQLVNYYTKNNAQDDLYTASFDGVDHKVAFLTKPEWVKPIDIGKEHIVVYDENVVNPPSFKPDNKVLNRRRALGSTLIDNPTTYFKGIEEGKVPRITAATCSYFEMATTLIGLEDEFYSSIQKNSHKTPLRDRIFANLDTIISQNERPLSLGCTAVILLKKKGAWKILVHTRSFSTSTNSGKISTVPSFGMALPKKYPCDEVEDLLWYNFQKEYCEEVCGVDSLIDEFDKKGKPINPLWFLKGTLIEDYRIKGKYKLYYLGFGVDAINGSGNVILAAVFDDEKASQCVMDETKTTEEGDGQDYVSFDEARFLGLLKAGKLTAPTAFALSEASKLLANLFTQSTPTDKLAKKLKEAKNTLGEQEVTA